MPRCCAGKARAVNQLQTISMMIFRRGSKATAAATAAARGRRRKYGDEIDEANNSERKREREVTKTKRIARPGAGAGALVYSYCSVCRDVHYASSAYATTMTAAAATVMTSATPPPVRIAVAPLAVPPCTIV